MRLLLVFHFFPSIIACCIFFFQFNPASSSSRASQPTSNILLMSVNSLYISVYHRLLYPLQSALPHCGFFSPLPPPPSLILLHLIYSGSVSLISVMWSPYALIFTALLCRLFNNVSHHAIPWTSTIRQKKTSPPLPFTLTKKKKIDETIKKKTVSPSFPTV